MRSKFLAIILPSVALAGCVGGMDDDYYVSGPVAPPGKYVPEVYVPDIALDEDFFAAAGTNTVFFDTDESVLTPQARDVLERQALWLVTHRDVNFKVEGHADGTVRPSTSRLRHSLDHEPPCLTGGRFFRAPEPVSGRIAAMSAGRLPVLISCTR